MLPEHFCPIKLIESLGLAAVVTTLLLFSLIVGIWVNLFEPLSLMEIRQMTDNLYVIKFEIHVTNGGSNLR